MRTRASAPLVYGCPLRRHMEHQASFWTLFHLLANVFTVRSSLSVFPTGWYVDDYNRHLPIRFQCFNEGGAGVTWMFNGKNLSASTPCSVGQSRQVCGTALLISKFQDDYVGEYTCRSSLTGSEVHVRLGVQPTFVDHHQADYIAALGERVSLDCSVSRNVYPSALVTWYRHDGTAVNTGQRYIISNARLSDSGTYVCIATNSPLRRLGTQGKLVVLRVYGEFIYCKIQFVLIIHKTILLMYSSSLV